jgi:hypothetical protein
MSQLNLSTMYEYFLDSVARKREEKLVPIEDIDDMYSVNLQTNPEDVKHYTILNCNKYYVINREMFIRRANNVEKTLRKVPFFDTLVRPLLMQGEAVIAGGCLVNLFGGLDNSFGHCNIDVFFLNMGRHQIIDKVKWILREALDSEMKSPYQPAISSLSRVNIKFCENFIQIDKVQFIICTNNSKSILEILTSFDLDCCKLAFDGTHFYTTTLGALALTTSYCMSNRYLMNGYFGKFTRAVKYADRGFKVIFPQTNSTLLKQTIDAIIKPFGKVEKLTDKIEIMDITPIEELSGSSYYIDNLREIHCIFNESDCPLDIGESHEQPHTAFVKLYLDYLDHSVNALHYILYIRLCIHLFNGGAFEMCVESPGEIIKKDFSEEIQRTIKEIEEINMKNPRKTPTIKISHLKLTQRELNIMRKTLLSTQHLPLMEDEFLLGISRIHSAVLNRRSATAIQRCWKEYLYRPDNFLSTTYGSICHERFGSL